MTHFLTMITGFLWDYPVVFCCLGLSIFYTIKLKGIQFTGIGHAIQLVRGKYDEKNEEGTISHFQALFSALSATIGIGNMAGVAIAITMGGPGAVFWMWIAALFGMAVKFGECALGTLYREKDSQGRFRGGPMYYITKGLGSKWKPLAGLFAVCSALGAFGVGGMFQANQAALALATSFHVPKFVTGIGLAILVAGVVLGGIKRIGKVASVIVPFMCVIYVVAALLICVMNMSALPSILGMIVSDAFTGAAVSGGALGTVISIGIRRAIFSNEAGLGSAPIAHAAVKTNYPIREGFVASVGPFIDTIIVCTATAMVVILSGLYQGNVLEGIALTGVAFDQFLPGFGSMVIPLSAFLFAFSTMITWCYYGETSATFLFGNKVINPYRWLFISMVFLGSILQLGLVLQLSDLLVALMVLPNAVALFLLSPVVVRETKTYLKLLKSGFKPLVSTDQAVSVASKDPSVVPADQSH